MTAILMAVVVLLSLTGIYAIFSFIAWQRTREMGIRVALGGSLAMSPSRCFAPQ